MIYEYGGGSGIRTHGSLRIPGFQDRCFKPLSHPSQSAPGLDLALLADSRPAPFAAARCQLLPKSGNMPMTAHYYLDGLKVNGKRKRLFFATEAGAREELGN